MEEFRTNALFEERLPGSPAEKFRPDHRENSGSSWKRVPPVLFTHAVPFAKNLVGIGSSFAETMLLRVHSTFVRQLSGYAFAG